MKRCPAQPVRKERSKGGAQRSLRHHRRLQRSEVDGPARIAARQVYTSFTRSFGLARLDLLCWRCLEMNAMVVSESSFGTYGRDFSRFLKIFRWI